MRISGRKSSSHTQHRRQRRPTVLLGLIGVTAAFFVAQVFVEWWEPGFIRMYLGMTDQGVRDAYAWQFVTAPLLHIGPWHFLANVFVLYLLGRDLESILGQRHFLYLYVAGAIAGELGHLFLMPSQSVLFAASGGVAAVVVAYAAVLPELELSSSVFFIVPFRIKAKHVAYSTFALAALLLWVDRAPVVAHSAWLGGCAAGWLYAHLLGFGRPSFLQRFLRERRQEAQRYERMSPEQLIREEVDPLLDKISTHGFMSLSRRERRSLTKAREKILQNGSR
jgi:membrane associated rhomboid family serine protease